jgi:hypothetical protein
MKLTMDAARQLGESVSAGINWLSVLARESEASSVSLAGDQVSEVLAKMADALERVASGEVKASWTVDPRLPIRIRSLAAAASSWDPKEASSDRVVEQARSLLDDLWSRRGDG